jgi:hypothetical protein
MIIRNGAFVSNLCGGWLVLELCEKSWLFLNLSLIIIIIIIMPILYYVCLQGSLFILTFSASPSTTLGILNLNHISTRKHVIHHCENVEVKKELMSTFSNHGSFTAIIHSQTAPADLRPFTMKITYILATLFH